MKLYMQKITKIHIFCDDYNSAVFKGVIDYCQLKKCPLNIFMPRVTLKMKKDMLHVYNLMKYDILSQHEKIEENQKVDNPSSFQFIFSSVEQKQLFEALFEQELPSNCYKVFDKQCVLFNDTNRDAFVNHQINLFNKMQFAQPERTNIGVRNLYFYVKQAKAENAENGDRKVDQETLLKIEKNPKAPQLILVPLSSTLENNNLDLLKQFAEKLESFLKKNASVTAPVPYHFVQLVFTMQPAEKDLQVIKQFVKQINKINQKSEYVSGFFVQLFDQDFEVMAKSASFALISRHQKSLIIQKMNDFGCPCLSLQADEAEVPEGNLMIWEQELFEGGYILMTQGEDKLKGKLLPGDNTWEL